MTHFMVGEMFAGGADFGQAIIHYWESLKYDRDAVEVWVRLGGALLADGQVEEAAEVAVRARELSPEYAPAIKLMANTRWAQGHAEEAIAQFRHLIVLDPGDLDAHFRLGMVLVRSGRVADGAEVFQEIQGRSAFPPRLLIEIARVYGSVGEHERAIETYGELRERQPKNAQVLREMAQKYFELGRKPEAMAALEKVVSLRPGDLGSWQRLLRLYLEQGKLGQALGVTEEILRRDSTNVSIRKDHALLLEQTGNPDGALEEWQSLTTVVPEDPMVWEQLAARLWRRGETGKAAAAFETALRLDSTEIRLYHSLGSLYLDAGNYGRAQEVLEDGNRIYPDNAGIHFLLGTAVSRGGHPEKGLIHLRRALDLNPDQEDILFEMGISLESAGRMEESVGVFRRVIQINPGNSAAYNYIAYMYAEQGVHLDEAMGLVKMALELEPENPSYLDSLGWVLFRQGKPAAAEPFLRQAAELDPDQAVVHEHLGAVYYGMGMRGEAREAWERALELDPDNEAIAAQLRRMEGEIDQ